MALETKMTKSGSAKTWLGSWQTPLQNAGAAVGLGVVGDPVGLGVVGTLVGESVLVGLGDPVGVPVGRMDGLGVGDRVIVGFMVGVEVGTPSHSHPAARAPIDKVSH